MCLVALFSGAQSFKKQKKQLLTEYSVSVQRCDTMYQRYENEYERFTQMGRDFVASYWSISSLEQQLASSKRNVTRYQDKLMHLNVQDGVSLEKSDTVPTLIIDKIVGSLVQEIGLVKPLSRMEQTLELGGLSRKEQLDYLRNTIKDIEEEHKRVERNYQRLHATGQKMNVVSERLKSTQGLIVRRTEFMNAYLKFLTNELEKARNDFRKNGPNGFSDAYFVEFPELFPDDPRNVHSNEVLGALPGSIDYEKDIVSIPREENVVFVYVEETAEFPGGMGALKQYLTDNLRYPETARELGIEGKCYLQFVVNETGAISNVEVKRGVPQCPECDAEAIRLVEAMPNWIPAKNGGKVVDSLFNLPVSFKLK